MRGHTAATAESVRAFAHLCNLSVSILLGIDPGEMFPDVSHTGVRYWPHVVRTYVARPCVCVCVCVACVVVFATVGTFA